MLTLKRLLTGVAVVLVCVAGCGGPKSSPASKSEVVSGNSSLAQRPEPGKAIASPPEPVTLESRWAWKDVWMNVKDLGRCKLSAFGCAESSDEAKKGEFAVKDIDNHIVLSFDATALDADKCAALQVQLPNSQHAAVWWARESDVKADGYPFAPDRFEVMRNVEPGLFELDLSAAQNKANWNGPIRLLRIDPFGKPGGAFALQKVQAKLPRSAMWPEAAAIEAKLKPDDKTRAVALMTRAKMFGTPEDLDAVASVWYRDPSSATDADRTDLDAMGKQQAAKLLESGDAKTALLVYSALAKASGDPVGYLYTLRDSLSEAQRTAMWPAEPCVIVDSFDSATGEPLYPWSNKGERKVETNDVALGTGVDGGACAHLAIGAPKSHNISWYTATARIPIAEKPFTLRFWFKEAKTSPTKGIVLANLPAAKAYAYLSTNLEPIEDQNGWKRFELTGNIHQGLVDTEQKQGKDISNAAIEVVGISIEGGSNEFWLDKIEVCLPGPDAAPTPPQS